MYCLKCGKEISEGTAFCQHCGNPVNASVPVSEPVKNTAGSFFRSLQEKAKNMGESLSTASEDVKKEEKKKQTEKQITNTPRKKTKQYKQQGRFTEDIFANGFFSFTGGVIVDKLTGVNYLFVERGNAGGLTVLVDENGKPLVTKEDILEDTEKQGEGE